MIQNDDTIIRQAAIDAFLTELTKRERKNLLHTWSTVEVKYFITKMLEQLPSAQPEQRWIPCSETVDIPDHEIMACDKYGEMMFGYLVYEDDQWLCESDGSVMCDPIAWCELPEPYKERRE